MYENYGRIHKFQELFNKIHDSNIVSWTKMIGGYAIHGYRKDSLFFYLMKHLGTNTNNITFVCVLLTCNHVDLVDENFKHINNMSDSCCIIYKMNYYICIVNLLGHEDYHHYHLLKL